MKHVTNSCSAENGNFEGRHGSRSSNSRLVSRRSSLFLPSPDTLSAHPLPALLPGTGPYARAMLCCSFIPNTLQHPLRASRSSLGVSGPSHSRTPKGIEDPCCLPSNPEAGCPAGLESPRARQRQKVNDVPTEFLSGISPGQAWQ